MKYPTKTLHLHDGNLLVYSQMPVQVPKYSIEIERYAANRAEEWNDFVETSKNGTFLFDRRYMDYHSDRFKDSSLMIKTNGRLAALLPANIDGDTLKSHGGLTYGGLILNARTKAQETIEIFRAMKDYLAGNGVTAIIYKPVPYIYCRMPSQEDLYALFRTSEARLIARNISSAIDSRCRPQMAELRRRCARKARKAGISVGESRDFGSFWEVLRENLNIRFKATPTHTLNEITMLHRQFPDNIRLFTATRGGAVIAGAVVYVTGMAAHAQYLSANEEGKRIGALDMLLEWLCTEKFRDTPYFDFGTSNEDSGRYLNEGLANQKEGFGGRGIIYDTYLIPL